MLYPITMIGIYKIMNNVNKKVYIGKSIDIERRWKEELNGQLNTHLLRSMRKYGIENFDFSIVELCEKDELDEREKFYIKKFKSYIRGLGYNKTMGGDGGEWCDECRANASKRMKGKGNPFYGRHHTEETKRKLSEGRAGKKHWRYGKKSSPQTRQKQSETKMGALNPMAKKVYQYSLDGEFIDTYDSVSIASIKTGIGYSAIKNCANGRAKTASGYSWEYGQFVNRKWGNKASRCILCKTDNRHFKSLAETAKFYGITSCEVKRVCDNERRITHGRIFVYDVL